MTGNQDICQGNIDSSKELCMLTKADASKTAWFQSNKSDGASISLSYITSELREVLLKQIVKKFCHIILYVRFQTNICKTTNVLEMMAHLSGNMSKIK